LNPSLPERLKIATRQLHLEVERSPFMSSLLRGDLSMASYRALLLNLHAIYVALESELDRHGADPSIAAIWIDGIARAPALARDLDAIPSSVSDMAAGLRPSTLAYVDHLHAIGQRDPVRLIAHAYVRYLGDLSGGQILRRIVGDKLHAPVAFYDFGAVQDAQGLRDAFRQGLEQIKLVDLQTDVIVEEALAAFELHKSMFDELSACALPGDAGPR
jgi:heme oxygenase (biliverdin-producing, ferredoxin)